MTPLRGVDGPLASVQGPLARSVLRAPPLIGAPKGGHPDPMLRSGCRAKAIAHQRGVGERGRRRSGVASVPEYATVFACRVLTDAAAFEGPLFAPRGALLDLNRAPCTLEIRNQTGRETSPCARVARTNAVLALSTRSFPAVLSRRIGYASRVGGAQSG